MDCGCTHMIQNWSVKLQNGILLCQHGESCIEIVEGLWKCCMLCFCPLKNLCCTTQSHLTLQLVTQIVLLCCMIMCSLSSIQKITPAADNYILQIMWHLITVITSTVCSRTGTGKFANFGGSKFTHHRVGAFWNGMKSRKQVCVCFLLKMSVTVWILHMYKHIALHFLWCLQAENPL
jgi:hypothetical protein